MKRHELIHLQCHGCRLHREGGRHTIYTKPANATRPRHAEIDNRLACKICEQLAIAPTLTHSSLDHPLLGFYTSGMEVHLTPDQQARLTQLASRIGKEAEQVVLEAVDRMLEDETRFAEEVRRGFASLDRGESVDHDEVGARIDRLLQS